jgi:hypothetical protein
VICPPDVIFKRKIVSCLNLYFIKFKLKENLMPQRYPDKIQINDIKRLESDYLFLKKTDFMNNDSYRLISHILDDIWFIYIIQNEKSNMIKILETDDDLVNNALRCINEAAFNECSLKKFPI